MTLNFNSISYGYTGKKFMQNNRTWDTKTLKFNNFTLSDQTSLISISISEKILVNGTSPENFGNHEIFIS